MDYPVITKPKLEEIDVRPNLEEYYGLANSFSWPQLRRELDGLPSGGLNLAHEAIDRHARSHRANRVALYWEGTSGEEETYTFAQLKELTDKFANVLKELGVEKGDRVFLFMGRIPELYVAFFGILKAGAIAGPLFSAFGPDPVKDRLLDSGAKVLIVTPDLRNRIGDILKDLPDLKHVIVVNKNGRSQDALAPGDISYEKEMASASSDFEIVPTTEEDFSIMHYTSGTTGKPKGAVHAHLAALQHMATGRWALDLHDDDIYWCTADPGWVTGTSYGMSAPWTNGVSQVIYEGGFRASAWYQVIQKYGVTVWYTAPTAIRMLMKAGDEVPKRYDLSSLRYMCSVGEPLNPEAIVWGLSALNLAFHDNWWQTETGAILIANYPIQDIRLGSMGRPIPGITAAVVDDTGSEVEPGQEGDLAIRPGWPSMFRTYWQNQEMYDSKFKNGWYVTGDRARMDKDGYFWFIGRADDVINTAGHLVGPFEVESALIEHHAVAEAGVIGKPDPVAFEVVKAFVALHDGHDPTDRLRNEIMGFVRQKLSAAVAPREIQFVDSLPKTRSGKIMRRLLKARELGLPEGDTSTLEDD
ncbi:acetate--CoA ligase [SAR202 cluster bacterium AC-647-N09_OGT_505m]|nr:acetate--CoA ligase [SAR202 cluster bacterium AC-647-N09_OGT_505m]